jgi:hypothetical protein
MNYSGINPLLVRPWVTLYSGAHGTLRREHSKEPLRATKARLTVASCHLMSPDSPPGFPPWDRLHVSHGRQTLLPCAYGMACRRPVLDDDDLHLIFRIFLDHRPGHRHMTVGHIPEPYVGLLVLAEYVGMRCYLHKSNNYVMPAYLCMSALPYWSMSASPDNQCRPGPTPVDEGMICGSSILAYLVFGLGRASTEGIARPTKMIARAAQEQDLTYKARIRGDQVGLGFG